MSSDYLPFKRIPVLRKKDVRIPITIKKTKITNYVQVFLKKKRKKTVERRSLKKYTFVKTQILSEFCVNYEFATPDIYQKI